MSIIALTLLHSYCVAQRAGQLTPAHQRLRAHPQGTVPDVLDVIPHGASLRARSPKDAAPRLGACSGAPRRNVLTMACKIIQRYQISAKSDHRSRTTQRCLENRCSPQLWLSKCMWLIAFFTLMNRNRGKLSDKRLK